MVVASSPTHKHPAVGDATSRPPDHVPSSIYGGVGQGEGTSWGRQFLFLEEAWR